MLLQHFLLINIIHEATRDSRSVIVKQRVLQCQNVTCHCSLKQYTETFSDLINKLTFTSALKLNYNKSLFQKNATFFLSDTTQIKVWLDLGRVSFKVTTSLKLGNFCHLGHNNNHKVKVKQCTALINGLHLCCTFLVYRPLKLLCNTCQHSHTDGRGCHSPCPPAHQKQFNTFQCLRCSITYTRSQFEAILGPRILQQADWRSRGSNH